MACSHNLLTLGRAAAMMQLFTLFAAYMLKMAGIIITVNVPVFRLTAVVAFTDNNVLVRLIDRHGDALVKHVAFSVEQTTLHFRIFAVGDNPAIELGNILEAFLKHEAGQLLAANAPGTVSQNRFVLVFAQILPNPIRKLPEGLNLWTNRITEMTDIIFIVITSIDDNDIIALQLLVELLRR